MIAAVLFDLDETLLDRTASLVDFLADQHARFTASLGNVSLSRFRARFLALDARGMVPKSVVYPALLEEFGGSLEAAEALLADYRDRCSLFARPFPGMDDVLAALAARGLKLGIVSNGEAVFQSRQIDALGLRRRVDTILISEAEGLRKPDARIFHRAAARLGVTPSQCVFVGDNPGADILGARDAGMGSVWFSNGMGWPDGVPMAPVIRELVDLLEIPELGDSDPSLRGA